MHKNSQKRYIDSSFIYFITSSTFNRHPYFKHPLLCDLFIKELKLCKQLKKFELYVFCILPNHIHLLINPNDKFDISKIMKSLKENFSRDVNKLLNPNHSFNAGDTSTCRLPINRFINQNKKHHFTLPKFKWQKSFHDHIMRNEKDFYYHYRYTDYNYRKHELPENYQYTSLNYPDLINEICL